jgi:hypothetical protein
VGAVSVFGANPFDNFLKFRKNLPKRTITNSIVPSLTSPLTQQQQQ